MCMTLAKEVSSMLFSNQRTEPQSYWRLALTAPLFWLNNSDKQTWVVHVPHILIEKLQQNTNYYSHNNIYRLSVARVWFSCMYLWFGGGLFHAGKLLFAIFVLSLSPKAPWVHYESTMPKPVRLHHVSRYSPQRQVRAHRLRGRLQVHSLLFGSCMCRGAKGKIGEGKYRSVTLITKKMHSNTDAVLLSGQLWRTATAGLHSLLHRSVQTGVPA